MQKIVIIKIHHSHNNIIIVMITIGLFFRRNGVVNWCSRCTFAGGYILSRCIFELCKFTRQ